MAANPSASPLSPEARGALKLTPDEFVFFNRQLASMCRLDIPLAEGLLALSKEVTSRALRDMVVDVQMDVANGERISNVTKRYTKVFPTLYTGMLEAGEVAGNLPQILDNLGSYSLSALRIRKRIQMAFLYPVLVIGVVISIMYLVGLYVVPQFQSVFESVGKDLPGSTKVILAVSHFLQRAGWLFPVFVLAALFGLWWVARTRTFRHWVDRVGAKMPLYGAIARFGSYFLFCRTFALLLRAGLPLASSLDLMRQAFAKGSLHQVCEEMHKAAVNGEKVSDAARSSGYFPETLVWKLGFGEKKGDLAPALEELAGFYESETNLASERFQTILGPAVVSVAGIIVGLSYFALFIPIIRMQEVVRGR